MEDKNIEISTSTSYDENNNSPILSNIFNKEFEDVIADLSPAQLLQLERDVEKLKKQSLHHNLKGVSPPPTSPIHHHHQSYNHHHHQNSINSSGSGNSAKNSSYYHSPNSGSSHLSHHLGHHSQIYHSNSASFGPGQENIDSPVGSRIHHSTHSTNLPASCPILEIRDGLEFLTFTYSTKGQMQEFSIKTDIDSINLDEIPDDFKAENCVYPRAFCSRDQYIGNRWEYETACNELAWKLSWINSEILSGKRGLIQRAVDSYRNRLTEMRSRRVVRQEKLTNGTLRRRTSEQPHHHHQTTNSESSAASSYVGGAPTGGENSSTSGSGVSKTSAKQITVPYTNKGAVAKMRILINIEDVDENLIDENFKRENSIYSNAEQGIPGQADYENQLNSIAWRLAWLNPTKLANKVLLLQKAVDCYQQFMAGGGASGSGGGRGRKRTYEHHHHLMAGGGIPGEYASAGGAGSHHHGGSGGSNDVAKQEDFSAFVADTMQRLSHHDLSSVVGDLELNGHGSQGYESFHPHMYDSSSTGFYH